MGDDDEAGEVVGIPCQVKCESTYLYDRNADEFATISFNDREVLKNNESYIQNDEYSLFSSTTNI